LLGVRTLLCDNCNFEFRAFSPFPPKSSRHRRQKRKADVFNNAPAVDLHALVDAGGPHAAGRRAPVPIPFDRAGLPKFSPPAPLGAAEIVTVADQETGLPPDFDELPPAALGQVYAPAPHESLEEEFARPLRNSPINPAQTLPQGLRDRLVTPPSVNTEEPLMRLKEELVERRSHAAQYTCPDCGSHEVVRRHRKFWERLVFGLTSIRPYRCERCGRRFHARRQTQQSSLIKQREAEFLKESCFNQTEENGE
jgi:hypothetical protein